MDMFDNPDNRTVSKQNDNPGNIFFKKKQLICLTTQTTYFFQNQINIFDITDNMVQNKTNIIVDNPDINSIRNL